MPGRTGYFQRLVGAILGRDLPVEPVAPVPVVAPDSSELARVRMDLEDRNLRIAAMKQEYAQLEEARDRAAAGTGQEQLDQLFKKLTGALSNLAALNDLAQAGQTVAAKDLLVLVRSVLKDLDRVGLQQVGRVGEKVAFDPAIHQRMSGGGVQAGTPVVVEVPGFRVREKVLLKAMASAGE